MPSVAMAPCWGSSRSLLPAAALVVLCASGAARQVFCLPSRSQSFAAGGAVELRRGGARGVRPVSRPVSACRHLVAVARKASGDAPASEELPAWVWKAVILLLCMIWATNFAVIKEITAQPGVTTQLYAVSRFTVAGTIMAPLILGISSQQILLRAIECGSWVAFGYIGQAIGLMTTTASKSCFICCLNVVFVSLIVSLTKKKVDPQTVAAATLAICGVAFLELAGSQQFVIGDLFSLAQPIGFGMGYIRLEQIMSDSPKDAFAVTGVKVTVVALAAWAFYLVSNGSLPDLGPVLESPAALTGVLYTGLVTTAFALLVESVAFRYVDAPSASVIFTTEPLWAAIFAVWLISEPFSTVDAVGGAFVIGANVVKNVPPSSLPWYSEADDDGNRR